MGIVSDDRRPAVLDGVDALTADGRIVTVRPVHAADRPTLADLRQQAPGGNLRRFFACPGTAELDRLGGPCPARPFAPVGTEPNATLRRLRGADGS